jgi:hypothetical protein|tara:strand:+ start:1100 stop:1240 length:141 start_codon:yes stop_codon:yes gene_type:complete
MRADVHAESGDYPMGMPVIRTGQDLLERKKDKQKRYFFIRGMKWRK